MSQIKSSTLHGRHAKTLCPLNWTWSAERSSQMVAVVPAKHNSKMQSIHYSYAQPCGPCGVQWRSGIMARSRHAPLLLTYLILFLQVIRNWIYLLLWSGHYGTGETTYTLASQHNLYLGKPTLPLDKVIEFAHECLTESVTSTRCLHTLHNAQQQLGLHQRHMVSRSTLMGHICRGWTCWNRGSDPQQRRSGYGLIYPTNPHASISYWSRSLGSNESFGACTRTWFW